MVGRSAVVSLVGGFGVLVLSSALSGAAPSGPPVRIGSTLALTGPLASQAIIHKIVADIYVDRLNRKNGLLGRPVDYVLLDDQSKPEVTRVLYERLITSDKVDLVLGAFGTGLNMAAMPVAQRYQKILITATMGIPKLSTYDMHFSTQGIGAEPEKAFPNSVFDALASTGKPPRTVAIVTSKFPSLHFISVGAREVATKRGMSVSLYLEYEFGTRDFGPIAARIKEANADFLWAGALGMEGNMLLEALAKIGHAPRGHLYIFPASGPLAQLPEAKYALSLTVFEEHPPFTDNPVAAEFVKVFDEAAAKAGLPYPKVEQQAAISYAMWQVLEAAVTATRSLEDKVLAKWLKTNAVDTIIGKQRFDHPTYHGFGDDLLKVRQLQEGRWVVVWPRQWTAPGATVTYPSP
ncbi:MAG: ABC transporter substrate-binding protein [Candidatus Rokuibacteriota bacterium]|nr:MAG: ABC transporter substrate-binding protein [Candidatus Rokubacteria bacterium]